MLIELILLGTFLALLWIAFKYKPRPANFPPGPNGYPIVGAGPMIQKLGSSFGPALARFGQMYGSVAGCRLGLIPTVIINGPEAIRESLLNDSYIGRPKFITSFSGEKKGIMFVDGDFWKTQRRFTLRHLRDWGFGKTSLENVIHEEVEECMIQMEKKVGKTEDGIISIQDLFGVSVINILWTVLAGKRHSHDDEDFKKLLYHVNQIFRLGNPFGSFLTRLPILRFIPYLGAPVRQQLEGRKEVTAFIRSHIEAHQKTRDPENPRDFIDEYLHALEDIPDGKAADPSFSVSQLISICVDLFTAGAESTSNSIAFAILYMVLYPEVQDKVRNEIISVAGTDHLLSYSDRSKVPYTEAVLGELQRVSSIAPITPPHSTLEEIHLGGYTIPKDTFTIMNLYSAHNDQSTWGDPENFRPERFLDSDGNLIKSDNLIPFGIGKRSCPGEPLARMTIFIFFTALLQRYKFERNPSKPEPSTVPLPGFTVAPQPFTATVQKLC